MPSFPVHHQLPELAQTHVHRVGDAIQPSRPLLSPSPPAPSPSQHQSLFPVSHFFTSGGQTFAASASASVLPMTIHVFLQNGLVGSPCSPRDSQESSPTPQFKSISSSVLSLHYGPALTSTRDHRKNIALAMQTFVSKMTSLLFNTLSRFVIAFPIRSNRLLVSWLQSVRYSHLISATALGWTSPKQI